MTREQLIAYLLHQMPDEERMALAERAVTDQSAHDELSAMEAELLDAYVRDELPSDQRTRVEAFLLASDVQRRKLAFSKALSEALPARETKPVNWRFLAAAAAVLVAVSAGLWLAVQNAALRREISSATAIPAPVITGNVVSLFLPSVALRSPAARPTVGLPANADVLRLDLELEAGDEQGSHSASLTTSGAVVWRVEPVRPARRGDTTTATIWIPATQLTAGSYDIAIKRGDTDIARFTFQIDRR